MPPTMSHWLWLIPLAKGNWPAMRYPPSVGVTRAEGRIDAAMATSGPSAQTAFCAPRQTD